MSDLRRFRLGVDIGGTFTDAMAIDETNGDLYVAKVPSTPADPSRGFLAATDRILEVAQLSPEEVTCVMHGTTVATNAIIEGRRPTIGMLLTAGFGDLMEIQRQVRPVLYDLRFSKLAPLVPRDLCFEVRERVNARGKIVIPLVEDDILSAIEVLRRRQIRSVAVCFLHSYLEPSHEQRVADIFRREYPQAALSLSSDLCPEFREYPRASTTAINAIVQPVVSRYLRSIKQRLRRRRVAAELFVMQSNGGVLSFEVAMEQPVHTVESGPAAGVIAANYIASALGETDILSFDMGGTTAKAGLVRNGQPRVTKEFEVGTIAQSEMGPTQAKGYPLRVPVIDLVEIGAGGGSIAWIDSGGILRVGPKSAGADPGPVCYGRGSDPTVTDANLVLGRLSSDYFLGGEMQLDVDAARKAIVQRCAKPLALDLHMAAYGIIEIANNTMMNALRSVSIQRGHDPRKFVLVAFGGAGPGHANRLAQELDVRLTIIPLSAGIATALGLLATDLKHEYSVTRIMESEVADPSHVNDIYRDLERRGARTLARERIPAERIEFVRQVEMRYIGQSYELSVAVPEGELGPSDILEIIDRFHIEHDRAYGRAAPDQGTELVNFRLTAIGKIPQLRLRELSADGTKPKQAVKHTRDVFFAEAGGFISTPVYDRYQLRPGHAIVGPAVVEEMDSTIIIHPRFRATIDRYGNLLLRKLSSRSKVVRGTGVEMHSKG